jgi:hypothetical protein
MTTDLLRFNGAVEHDPAIDAWMKQHAGELGAIAHRWFQVMRKCGDEVRELLHDGYPIVCLGDAPFGYVNVFTSHVNVGTDTRKQKAFQERFGGRGLLGQAAQTPCISICQAARETSKSCETPFTSM